MHIDFLRAAQPTHRRNKNVLVKRFEYVREDSIQQLLMS